MFYYLVRVLATNFNCTLTLQCFLANNECWVHSAKSTLLLTTHRSNLKLFVIYVSTKLVLPTHWQTWFAEIFWYLPFKRVDSVHQVSNVGDFEEGGQREAGCKADLPKWLSTLLFAHADLLHLHNSEETFIPFSSQCLSSRPSRFAFISSPAIMER